MRVPIIMSVWFTMLQRRAHAVRPFATLGSRGGGPLARLGLGPTGRGRRRTRTSAPSPLRLWAARCVASALTSYGNFHRARLSRLVTRGERGRCCCCCCSCLASPSPTLLPFLRRRTRLGAPWQLPPQLLLPTGRPWHWHPSPLAAFLGGFPPKETSAMCVAVACGAADGASATAAASDAAA